MKMKNKTKKRTKKVSSKEAADEIIYEMKRKIFNDWIKLAHCLANDPDTPRAARALCDSVCMLNEMSIHEIDEFIKAHYKDHNEDTLHTGVH